MSPLLPVSPVMGRRVSPVSLHALTTPLGIRQRQNLAPRLSPISCRSTVGASPPAASFPPSSSCALSPNLRRAGLSGLLLSSTPGTSCETTRITRRAGASSSSSSSSSPRSSSDFLGSACSCVSACFSSPRLSPFRPPLRFDLAITTRASRMLKDFAAKKQLASQARAFSALTRDSVEIQPAFDRLEGFLLSNLPPEVTNNQQLLSSLLGRSGLPVPPLTDASSSSSSSPSSSSTSSSSSSSNSASILLQRSRLGRTAGRCLVLLPFPSSAFLTGEDRKALQTRLAAVLPAGSTVTACDRNDVENCIEEFERYFFLTEDLQRLGVPSNLRKVVTLSPVPPTYGRREVRDLLREHANVDVDPRDIVFRFRKDGVQGDTCYVLCRSERDAGVVLARIQETAVPNRVHYGQLFGCSFLWASRSALFLCDSQLDYLPARSPFQVFTTGWEGDVSEEEFKNLAYQLRLFPKAVRKFSHPGGEDVSSFFLEFHRMRDAKLTMSRLQLLRRRWRIGANTPFFGFLRMADLRFEDDVKFADEDSAADSDLDEPIDY
ncbi:hypothetical protein TGME49_229740 [Toxoplasma gondii ME49]|uniref:Uncharacterized protein n=1 Tax=Toxoplasma gondii (strain ATCC 50611 / Me49) TaxID=508771 RepID=S8F063_TOXGM|nr:hypothetical protein TGME49_229740 [Toxoplasma gondii ME49]EPT29071.1 hypothetical protein TGME49_229740 [Toxoplasma gondii ME49]|eukprot:XP_018636906.1 hypothetical protein TGME49_229740 [Toxoplasma gondii ME49]